MATATFSAAPDNTSDATFRAWGSALSAAIQAVGLVKTADTGMPNWTTVTKPAGAAYVYECFRLNDSLQATVPIFLRIGYGAAATAANPAISLQVGKGTNGTNSLTSAIGTEQKASCSAPNVAATWYVSSADGSQLFIAGPLTQDWGTAVSVFFERSRGPSGTATGAGGLFGLRSGTSASSNPTALSFNYVNPTTIINASAFTSLPGASQYTSLNVGGVVPIAVTLNTDGYGAFWQSRVLLGYVKDDAAVAVPITVPGFGVYLPLGANMTNTSFNNRAAAAWY